MNAIVPVSKSHGGARIHTDIIQGGGKEGFYIEPYAERKARLASERAALLQPVEPKPYRNPCDKLTAEIEAELRRLWADGASNKWLAGHFDVNKTTLNNWRKRLKLPLKQPWRSPAERLVNAQVHLRLTPRMRDHVNRVSAAKKQSASNYVRALIMRDMALK